MRHRYEHHRRYKLHPTEDFTNIQFLIPAIRRIANLNNTTSSSTITTAASANNSNSIRRKRYLVIVNPFSGQKKAKQIYESFAKKMFDECGIDHDVLITQHEGHAFERMQHQQRKYQDMNDTIPHDNDDDDVSEYDAIIAMGGDGILSEILNGLQTRKDYETIVQKIKFGIVGCGTCNGLAASLLYAAKVRGYI